MYDAINKGIKFSRGLIITILNSDDFYNYKSVISDVIKKFRESKDTMCVYGDLVYVSRFDINNTVRVWKSSIYKRNSFLSGWSPPHPTFFIKKKCFNICGMYKVNIGNSADVEFMYRCFEKYKFINLYLKKTLVKMRIGGRSNKNYISVIKQNIVIIKFLKLYKNPYLLIRFFAFKIFNRLLQIFYAKLY